MNIRRILVGAIVFWLVTNILGMFVTGILIHEKILDPVYRAHSEFWLPELNQDPPDMGALMPRWLLSSFLASLAIAGIYGCVMGSFQGSGLRRGLIWGLCLAALTCTMNLGWSGVFNLPGSLWFWWCVDGLVLSVIGGAAMGWAVEKWGG